MNNQLPTTINEVIEPNAKESWEMTPEEYGNSVGSPPVYPGLGLDISPVQFALMSKSGSMALVKQRKATRDAAREAYNSAKENWEESVKDAYRSGKLSAKDVFGKPDYDERESVILGAFSPLSAFNIAKLSEGARGRYYSYLDNVAQGKPLPKTAFDEFPQLDPNFGREAAEAKIAADAIASNQKRMAELFHLWALGSHKTINVGDAIAGMKVVALEDKAMKLIDGKGRPRSLKYSQFYRLGNDARRIGYSKIEGGEVGAVLSEYPEFAEFIARNHPDLTPAPMKGC